MSFGASGVCSFSGGTVTMTSVGTCTVTADQAGNASFNAAPQVTQVFTVGKAAGTISISNVPVTATFGGSFTPTYTSNSDGTKSTASLTSAVCTVTSGVVNYVGSGTCTLQASVAAGTNWTAATGTSQSFTVGKAAGTISISNVPVTATFGGSFTPTYTSNSDGTKSTASLTSAVCTVTSGVVNYVGSGTCTLQASVAAGTNWTAATGTSQSFTVGKAAGTISISNVPVTATFGGSFTPTYTSNSDGTKSTASLTSAVCTVTSGVVNYVGSGTCTLQASVAAGTNWTAATGTSQSFTVDKAAGSVSINDIPSSAVFGGQFTATYDQFGDGTPSVVSETTLVCTVSGNVVSYVAAGFCSLHAAVTAGANYKAATGATQSFSITRATPVVTVTWVSPQVFDGGTHPASASVAGVGSPAADLGSADSFTYYDGGTVSGSGSSTPPTNVGTYTVVAHFNQTANYSAADSAPKVLSITRATPVVTVTWVSPQVFDGGTHPASASVAGVGSPAADLGSADSFTYYDGGTVSGSGSSTPPTNVGTYTMVAHFNQTANYSAADSAPKVLSITRATPVVTVTWVSPQVFDGGTHPASASVAGVGSPAADLGSADSFTYYDGGTVSGSGSSTPPTNVGTYTVVAHFNQTANYSAADSAPKVLSITRATPVVTVTWVSPQVFDGGTHPASASVAGVGSPAADLGSADSFTYYDGGTVSGSGSSTPPTNVGTYTVVAHFNQTANYSAADSAPKVLSITRATPVVTVTWVSPQVFDGGTHPASASVAGVGSPAADLGSADSFTYYDGGTVSGSGSSTPPTNVGTYTVVAHFNQTANYSAADSAPKVLSITRATPVVTVTWVSPQVFDGGTHPASASVAGVGSPAADLGSADSFTYYDGGTVSGSGSSTPPTNVGTYTVVAHFNQTANYSAADSAPKVLSITRATPVVTVTWVSPQVFDGGTHPASASVAGVGSPAADLGSADSFTYYDGGTVSGSGSSTPPTNVGTYTVVAHFNQTANYSAADSAPKVLSITRATPVVTVTWVSPQVFDGGTHPASASVAGVGSPAADLGSADSFTYYDGGTVSGSGSSTPPTNVGTYTMVAHFNQTANYSAADSAPKVLSITRATPVVTVTWVSPQVFDGGTHPASASVAGVGSPAADLGSADSFTYYDGGTVSGSGSSTPPTNVGTYTMVAHFNQTANYSAADSAPKVLSITRATPVVTVTWVSPQVFDGGTHPASASVAGVGSPAADLGSADSFTYYDGGTVSGSGSSTPPTNVGTYTVVAHFNQTANYSAADSAPKVLSITRATPVVTVTWVSPQVFDGGTHPASASVAGVGSPAADLGSADSFTYYDGGTVSGSGSSTPPTNVGTYTVVAHFNQTANYSAADSAPRCSRSRGRRRW